MTSPAPSSRPELVELRLGGSAAPWQRLGLTVADGAIGIGGVTLRFGGEAAGIASWALAGAGPTPLPGHDAGPPAPDAGHPLGVVGIDHVVALTADLDQTVSELVIAGLDHRRTRDAGEGRRQAFFLLGPCLLELVGPAEGPTRFWGLTLVVADLDDAAVRLGDLLGPVRDAVQRGRRIATVRREAELGVPVALMSPRH